MTQIEFIIRLGVAVLLGSALGLERRWRRGRLYMSCSRF